MLTFDSTGNENEIVVKNKNIHLVLNKKSGYLTQLNSNGIAILESPLKLNFWRAETENDEAYRKAKKLSKELDWMQAGDRLVVSKIEVNETDKTKINIHPIFSH